MKKRTSLFDYRPIPKPDIKPVDVGDAQKMPDVPTVRKKFEDTRLGRVVLGKNTVGEILHGVIDVLPVPNIHEVIKKVIKDADTGDIDAGYVDVLIESAKRLDWTRTAIALAASVLLIKGSDWLGIELDKLFVIFERIIDLL